MEPNIPISEDQKEKTTKINLQISPDNIGIKYIQELSDIIENNNLYFGIYVSITGVAVLSLLLLVQISSPRIIIGTYIVSVDDTMVVAAVVSFIGFLGCVFSANAAHINIKKRNKIFGIEGEN